MILNQELNKLKLVCSGALLPKIEEYKRLSSDYVDEFQIVLNRISTQKDINVTAKELENIGHSDRIPMMTELWQTIEKMMRKEIGYYKNKTMLSNEDKIKIKQEIDKKVSNLTCPMCQNKSL